LSKPSYENNIEGRITVSIRVDANGKVIGATIGSPTNISDVKTRNAAVNAAKSTRFTAGNGISTGSITYNFRLK
jgi:TonB family protein